VCRTMAPHGTRLLPRPRGAKTTGTERLACWASRDYAGNVGAEGNHRTVGSLPPWYDLLDAVCLGVLLVVALGAAWILLDRRTLLSRLLRTLGRRPGVPAMLLAILALSVLYVTAEAVLDHREDEFLADVDVVVRDAAHAATAWSVLRTGADAVSELTWPTLTAAVLTAEFGLLRRRRWRESAVLLVGTLGAWALFAAVKAVLSVPRPRVLAHHRVVITSYSFPSGHVIMTLVVTGLIIWTIRRVTLERSWPLYAGAILIAGVVGAARVLVDAHWLTDVVGSLALGTLWLIAVVSVCALRSRPHPAA
jgi:membrane-associated phospholipid phosphatase